MTRPHILLIEDDSDIASILKADLEEAGYQVSTAFSVMKGLLQYRELQPDLVITDLRLPDGDGRDIVKRLRKDNRVPIIVLSAHDDVVDKVELLEAGANDYVVKPFSIEEVLARVGVQLRASVLRDGILVCGELELQTLKHRVTLRGQMVDLSPMEFSLLGLLLQQPGRVYARGDIAKVLWNGGEVGNVLDVHVANLRGKLRQHGASGLLRTVRGVGFAIRC